MCRMIECTIHPLNQIRMGLEILMSWLSSAGFLVNLGRKLNIITIQMWKRNCLGEEKLWSPCHSQTSGQVGASKIPELVS